MVIKNHKYTLYIYHIYILFKVEIRVFADGASNRVYEKFHEKYIPNAICGDLDSIKKDVRSFYESKGVEIYHDACQDYDDMTKSINYITSKYPKVNNYNYHNFI